METLCNISLQHIPLFFLHIDKAWRNIKTFGHAVVIKDTHALQLISGVSTDTPLPLRMETLCNISLETLSFVLSAHPLQLLSGVSTDTPLPLRMDSMKHFIGNIFLCFFCLFTATKKWGQHRHASATKDGNSLQHCIGNTFLCSFSLNQGTEAFHRDDAAKG